MRLRNVLTVWFGMVFAVATIFVSPAGAQDTSTFSNTNSIVVPANSPATTYPATIDVSGLTGTVSNVTVTLNGLNSDEISSLGVLLVGPTGESVGLIDYVGTGSILDETYTFDDSASAYLPYIGDPGSGTYLPTVYDTFGFPTSQNDTFASPAPQSGYSSVGLSTFDGTAPNGTYSLYAEDFFGFNHDISGGYSLSITTLPDITDVPEGGNIALLIGMGASSVILVRHRRRRSDARVART